MEVELSGDRHDMTDAEWEVLRPVLPTGRQGPVRKDDRRIMDGIFFILRTGSPWRDLPERYGPYTTCYNRYNRWSKDGIWAMIISELQRVAGSDGDDGDGPGGGSATSLGERMIDSLGGACAQAWLRLAPGRRAARDRSQPWRADNEDPCCCGRCRAVAYGAPVAGTGGRLHACAGVAGRS